MDKINLLRKKYPQFIYHSYSSSLLGSNFVMSFHFEIKPGIYFTPVVTIKNVNPQKVKRIPKVILDNLIFHLGLIEIPSYWKATCSPKIVIRAGYLNKEQIKWWKNLLFKGLGQFFFTNKIDFLKKNFVVIESKRELSTLSKFHFRFENNNILDVYLPR